MGDSDRAAMTMVASPNALPQKMFRCRPESTRGGLTTRDPGDSQKNILVTRILLPSDPGSRRPATRLSGTLVCDPLKQDRKAHIAPHGPGKMLWDHAGQPHHIDIGKPNP